jgi:3-phenylpropionate/trans-cinnamate dioxygenase ferredoxin subunit
MRNQAHDGQDGKERAMSKTPVSGAAGLRPGEMKKFTVNGTDLLIARLDEGFFALANKCPHMGGSLADGVLEGDVVRCPRHGARYDLRTGNNVGEATLLFIKTKPGAAKSFPASLEDGVVYVDLG